MNAYAPPSAPLNFILVTLKHRKHPAANRANS
jgi:hypothetical protein